MKRKGNLHISPSALPNFTFTTKHTERQHVCCVCSLDKSIWYLRNRCKYLAHPPTSSAHHHQNGNLHQSQHLEQTRGPGDHLYHRMDNHHHALKIKPMLSQHIFYTTTLLIEWIVLVCLLNVVETCNSMSGLIHIHICYFCLQYPVT